MSVIIEKAEEYEVKADDTLEKIADDAKQKYGDAVGDWKLIARYNWGTDQPREVVRALAETVGVKLANDLKQADWDTVIGAPEKIKLAPDADLPAAKLKIPKPFKKEGLGVEKTHTVKVKRAPTPANAVSIPALDKWFIPQEEECELKLRLEGEIRYADKLQLDVYGSKYCECTDWGKGLGTYGSPDDLIDVPVMDIPNVNIEERQERAINGWKGEVSAEKGLLSRLTGKAKERFINVAFSPYTAHFRYFKNDSDEKARLILEAFWPEFEETKKETTDADVGDTGIAGLFDADGGGGGAKAVWTNAAKADRGAVVIKDKDGQRVHLIALPDDKLAAGLQDLPWDGKYRPDAMSSKFGDTFIDEDGPYAATITTITRKPKADSLKIKWEFKNTGGKLERGLLQVFDGKDRLVFQKPLPKAKLADGKQELEWKDEGKYAEGVKNSKDGDKIIPEDLPYRVQIQAHTGIDKPEGLALAAMHTEVRLYSHPKMFAPKDVLYDSWNAKNSLSLLRAPHVPGDAPEKADGTRWYQHQLAEYGFYPGPVTGSANEHLRLALQEFKRSVPKRKTGADYERLGIDDAENAETQEAIEHIEEKYKRKIYGDLSKVCGNNNAPDLSDDEIKNNLGDPTKDLIVWVDDRQYYTAGSANDDANADFFTGSASAQLFGLQNYRGDMDIADGKTTRDTQDIPRPWLALRAGMQLLSRTKGLYEEVPAVTDDALRDKMARCIGPLRVDWTFEELPPDISTINAAAYNHSFSRSRRYVAWALKEQKGTHERKDTGQKAIYTNCPEALGGSRPSALGDYYKQMFGTGDLHLAPWRAAEVSKTESVATVVHDHIAEGQKDKEKEADKTKVTLFESLIGVAGAYFRPSRVAGDGYRVRAEVQFEKFTDYEFPNLAALAARYPVPPQAHSARLRVWRRSSVRGYMCWAAAGTGHWPGLIDGMRDRYRAAHVYFVHEGGTAQNYAINTVFNPATDAHKTRYKNLIHNNVNATYGDEAKIQLRAADIWPWGHRVSLGPRWFRSPVDIDTAKLYDNWLSPLVIEPTWRVFRDALLLALVQQVEKKGYMRGHLFVEFAASPALFLEEYKCDDVTTPHTYYYLEKSGSNGPPDGPCKAPGCTGTLSAQGTGYDYDSLPLPAVGIALGATWLFTTSDAATWAHEIGHHRHLEHAASAPGAQYADRDVTDPVPNAELHDSQDNSTQAWAGLGVTDTSEQDWDRECIMSYSNAATLYFCGKCLLRNRGWGVQGLGGPGAEKKEPTP